MLAEGSGAQSSRSKVLTVPASEFEEGSEPTEAELAAFFADEEVVDELQSLQDILDPPPAWANPEMVAGVRVARQRVVAHRVQRAVDSTPPTLPEATPLDPDG